MKYVLPILAIIIALGSMMYMNFKLSSQQDAFSEMLSKRNRMVTQQAIEEEPELAEYMRALQWNMNKLYFAGTATNQKLIDFYVREIEEVVEGVAHAGIMDDGIPVSKHMKTYGVQGIEQFEIEMKSEFESAYSNLMNTCNSCHLATEHGFIQIKAPEYPVSDNQVF